MAGSWRWNGIGSRIALLEVEVGVTFPFIIMRIIPALTRKVPAFLTFFWLAYRSVLYSYWIYDDTITTSLNAIHDLPGQTPFVYQTAARTICPFQNLLLQYPLNGDGSSSDDDEAKESSAFIPLFSKIWKFLASNPEGEENGDAEGNSTTSVTTATSSECASLFAF